MKREDSRERERERECVYVGACVTVVSPRVRWVILSDRDKQHWGLFLT